MVYCCNDVVALGLLYFCTKIRYPLLFLQEVTWDEWLGDLVTRKRKLGQLDDKIVQLEMEFELLEKEERELIKEQS